VSRPVVYLHVGEPKSGTTFLQEVMWGNRSVLAEQGVLLPGIGPQDHFRANQDLREVPQAPDDPAGSYRGEWELLVRHALTARRAAVISNELLAAATREQAARALETLSAAEVHIVLTVRDFVSVLPAEWQETVKHGNARLWRHWVGRVMRTEDAPRTAPGAWFWRVHDTLDVLRRWTRGIPPEHVHVVTVPPPGSPPELLWERFASVIGVDPGRADLSAARPNTSLGLAEAELLRRLNLELRDHIPEWYYAVHVKERIAHDVLAARPATTHPRLGPHRAEWAAARAEKVVAQLEEAGYQVVGSLDDLAPAPATRGRRGSGGPTSDDVLDAAIDALSAVIRSDYAAMTGGDGARAGTTRRVQRWLRDAGGRHRAVAAARTLLWRLAARSRARR
jgi:hypothetical protein